MDEKRTIGIPKGSKESGVRRITVDECLSEGLVRLLEAPLFEAPNGRIDDESVWGGEREILTTPASLLSDLGMKDQDAAAAVRAIIGDSPESAAPVESEKPPAAALWRSLSEGLVFLDGGFTVDAAGEDPRPVRTAGGIRNFLRLDRLAPEKEASEALYSAALRAAPRPGKGASDA